MNQSQKARAFRDLHRPGDPFVLPNAYDVGSAKMLAAVGAQAIATTSSGYAFSVGLPDFGHISRDEMLAHCAAMVRAVDLPVSADLEGGYAHDPEGVAETVRLAAEVGLVGCALEDVTPDPDRPFYDFDLAVARMAAAVEAADALPFPFTICARADGIMRGDYSVDEAIARLQAYEKVGAHCVYAPMLPTIDDLARTCAAVSIPVNVLCAGDFTRYTKTDFATAGAARISIGSVLSRVTHRIVHDIGVAMIGHGDFSSLSNAMPGDEVEALLAKGGV